MAVDVTDYNDLTAEEVQTQRALLLQRIKEANPGLNLQRGVFHDLIAYIHATIEASARSTADKFQRSTSLAGIAADPDLADVELVDNVLSTYGRTRQSASAATGTVVVVLSRLQSVTIPAGALFQSSDKQFRANIAYTSRRESANVVTDGDRLLSPLNDGNYAFTIEVTAVDTGEASQLRKDALLVPLSPPTGFVRAYAAADFTGGASAETTQEMIDKLELGMAAKTMSGRTTMNALLTSTEAFPDVVATSIVGAGDGEMRRDKHSILPVSLNGKVDWYVQSDKLPQRVGLTKNAALIQKTTDGFGIWELFLNRDDAPALYRVERIVRVGDDPILTGTFEITSDIRGRDLSAVDGLDLVPDIVNDAEAAFTRYQTVSLQFKDTETLTASLALGSLQAYSVTALAMRDIAAMQLLVGARGARHPGGDVLVKAPVPAFVRLSFEIFLAKGQETPDVDSIKADLAALVNTRGFTGRLPASELYDVVHNYLLRPASTSKMEMLAEILQPNGQLVYRNSDEVLLVPDDPAGMVSSRTTVFFLDPIDIAITVRTLETPPV